MASRAKVGHEQLKRNGHCAGAGQRAASLCGRARADPEVTNLNPKCSISAPISNTCFEPQP